MAKRRKVWIWALLPVAVLLVMFGVEAACQWRLLTLPDEQRGVTRLDLSAAQVSAAPQAEDGEAPYEEEWDEFEEGEEDAPGMAEDEAAPAVSLAAGQSLTLAVNGYVENLAFRAALGTDPTYVLTWRDGAGRSFSKTCYFFNKDDGEVHEDFVHVGSDVTEFTLTFSLSGAQVMSVQVHNAFHLNWNRMLLTGLAAAALYLLAALRKTVARRAEIGFLIVGLAVGLYMSIGVPTAVNLNYDDHLHYSRVQLLSHGRNASMSHMAYEVSEIQWSITANESFYLPADTWQDEQALTRAMNEQYDASARELTQTLQWQFSDVGYVNQAAAAAVGRWLNLPFTVQLILPRVMNMLTYVGLVYLAIRSVKRYKLTLAAIALMVTPMFLSASYTYDTLTNALCFLGTALTVDAMLDRETPLSWRRGVTILISLVLGAMSKVVYMPLLLLTLLLPRSKFDSRGARLWFKGVAVVTCLAGVLIMVGSVGSGAVTLTDSRAGGADAQAQMAFIFSHPLTYLGYFFATMWESGLFYFTEASRCTMAYIGGLGGIWCPLNLGMILFTAVTDSDPEGRMPMRWHQRLWLWLIGMMVVGMVFTTMYLAFSAVGQKDFGGVQGRYLIPVLPLMAMLLNPTGIRNRMNRTGWHLFFFIASLLPLLVVCWENIFTRFFL